MKRGTSNHNFTVTVENEERSQSVILKLKETTYKKLEKTITLAPKRKESFTVDAEASKGWYDFILELNGYSNFLVRYAGRTETGKDSITDPFMA